MTSQQQAAMQSLINWLAHEQELGRKPSKIELEQEFDLHGMRYYIFKYKKNILGKWLLGVCGGYEHPSDTDHCGHVFSEMEPYDPATAKDKSIAMVEMIRQHWMQRAAAIEAEQANSKEAENKSGGVFNGFILLNSPKCDLELIKSNLLEEWGISTSHEGDDGEDQAEKEGTLVFEVDGFMAAVSFVEAPVPDGEAVQNAQSNYLWKDAVEVTKTHVAQIILAVMTRSGSPLDAGRLYTKLASSCLKLPNAIGIYSSGTVFQPEIFIAFADIMKTDNSVPVLNLVHFGLVGTEGGVGGYTIGLNAFGKDEIEVLDSRSSPSDLRDFLINISSYIVEQNVTLRHGETIGFTPEQKLAITRSKGVFIGGDTLKISF
jgi:hypothetical protein